MLSGRIRVTFLSTCSLCGVVRMDYFTSVILQLIFKTRCRLFLSFWLMFPNQRQCLCVDCDRKMRDPFNNLGFLFKKTIERRKMSRKKPHFALKLYDYVHPEFGVSVIRVSGLIKPSTFTYVIFVPYITLPLFPYCFDCFQQSLLYTWIVICYNNKVLFPTKWQTKNLIF